MMSRCNNCNDFLPVDLSFLFRCGLLTFHVRLPYSYLQKPYVESAIRATYHRNICNCTVSDHTAYEQMAGIASHLASHGHFTVFKRLQSTFLWIRRQNPKSIQNKTQEVMKPHSDA